MKKAFFSLACIIGWVTIFSQPVNEKLQKAFRQFEADSQLKHALSSLYVIDGATGQVVFDRNSQIGLAPASTQKIITSVTAFELLGKDYRYKTELVYRGKIENNVLEGLLLVKGLGDPTLGSWRFAATGEEQVLNQWVADIEKSGIKKINGLVAKNSDNKWSKQYTPDGWIWQDIGNYYGAGADNLNWRENQYDMILKSGNKRGDEVSVVRTIPELPDTRFICEVVTGTEGSGDNAYIYLAPYAHAGIVTGTIPPGENAFKITGSLPRPAMQLLSQLQERLKREKIVISNAYETPMEEKLPDAKTISTIYSPSLDSIIYWFNKKSINLYGEALIKTLAYEKTGIGATDTGVSVLRKFWKEKGLDENELNIYDGSGLSPLNRVTTHAQVEILKYAKGSEWFSYFYDALPEYNAIKMKSGTISDVKGFCGYHTAKDGKQYIFSFLVNNYTGRSSELVSKMYKVLDNLK